jgi:hypothetical protein
LDIFAAEESELQFFDVFPERGEFVLADAPRVASENEAAWASVRETERS